jgi:hypothetical protein
MLVNCYGPVAWKVVSSTRVKLFPRCPVKEEGCFVPTNDSGGRTRMRATLSLLLLIVLAGLTSLPALSKPQSQPNDAKAWLAEAMSAMGGDEKLRSIHAIGLKGIGFRNELEQSERPEGPWVPDFYEIIELRDFVHNRMRTERRSRTLNGSGWTTADWSDPSITVMSGGALARFVQGKFAPVPASSAADVEETLSLDASRILFTALDAGDLRPEPPEEMHGFAQHVVRFSWHGENIRLFLSPGSHLPVAIEATRVRPGDLFQGPWGDVTLCTEFAIWSLDPSGILYPREWSRWMNGQPYSTYTVNELRLNPPVDDSSLAIPDDVRKASLASAFTLDDIPFAPIGPAGADGEIAPGVAVVASKPYSYRVTEIRQLDGIVILEGELADGFSSRVIADAQKRFPGLPIKAVITTSDSWPHIGGLREYAARGILIYALDLNKPILTRLMNALHTMQPDALAKNHSTPKFHFISERTSLGDGDSRIDIIPYRTATGERQMMVYFPSQKLLYTSDLFSLLEDGSLFLPVTAQEMLNAVAREKLQVDRIYGMHYDSMPMQKLLDVLANYRKLNPR